MDASNPINASQRVATQSARRNNLIIKTVGYTVAIPMAAALGEYAGLSSDWMTSASGLGPLLGIIFGSRSFEAYTKLREYRREAQPPAA